MKLKALIILGITVIGIGISANASAMGMLLVDQNYARRGSFVTFKTGGASTSPIMKTTAPEANTELGAVIAQVGSDLSTVTRSELTKVLEQAAADDKQTTLEVLRAAVEVLSEAGEESAL